jgi:CubicO group peptidase (beta-lactamase class C family)
MVEAASGQRLDRYMTRASSAPLGMSDTGFAIGPALRLRKARMHRARPRLSHAWSHEIPQSRSSTWAAAGSTRRSATISSSRARCVVAVPDPEASDVKRWRRNHMADGVLCRPLKSSSPHMSTDLDFVDGMQWGLSFMINPTAFPGRRRPQPPWGGFANSYYWIDPRKKVTGVVGDAAPAVLRPAAIAAFESVRARRLLGGVSLPARCGDPALYRTMAIPDSAAGEHAECPTHREQAGFNTNSAFSAVGHPPVPRAN